MTDSPIPIRRFLFLAVWLICLQACDFSPIERVPDPSLGFVLEPLELGEGNPRVFVRAQRFRHQLSTPRPVFLDGDYSLEFVPLLIEGTEAVDGAKLRIYVAVNGEETLLSATGLVATGSAALRGAGRLRLRDELVQVDLSAHRGTEMAFRWALDGSLGGAEVALADLRLRTRSSHTQRTRPTSCSSAPIPIAATTPSAASGRG